ncbi:short chain dehydrogenase [Hartmannibacter diazotrophicus]|uniref:Short chain dehydrogenase n=1 Tax=Hartmannibacter diazotrophicus TaxID=1482074 RepID=A0A2C9D1J4_9HYPH|nr:short chain dehydrogenase [Hartmannibacter diazotrophicus]
MSTTSRPAIVTGSSRGIGAAIASTAAFLTGPDASWINGQVLRANGGII